MRTGAEIVGSPKRIVVGGINNDMSAFVKGTGYVSCVFMLDPARTAGEAPPYFGKMSQGTELWYGLILPPGQGLHSVDISDVNHDGRNQVYVWDDRGHAFCIDFRGRVTQRGAADGVKENAYFALVDSGGKQRRTAAWTIGAGSVR